MFPTQVFSCETCEISRNIYFEEHLHTTASRYCYSQQQFAGCISVWDCVLRRKGIKSNATLVMLTLPFLFSFYWRRFWFTFVKATSKTWTRTLDSDPRPWTRTLDRTRKNWTLKNLNLEKHGKRLDMENWLEDHIL